jgi:hypothetical protein
MFTPSNIMRPSIRRVWLFTGINVLLFICITCIAAVAQNVNVTATAGTASASYTTLKGAFDAVNAGTHQGAITMDIAITTAEGATPAVLNSSGAGSASYTSVLIRPSVGGVNIVGAPPTGRGVIELNGADNVTIDGDNPNTAGTNRDLSIQNTAAATTTFTSVVRIALSTLVTSANNDVVKNCILTGSATGRNVSTATSQAGSEFTTYGILVGGGADTVSATNAPAAITSVTTTVGAGITATNFSADNNQIDACARGIAVQGAATTVANGLSVTNNVIGNPVGGNTTTVYARAMTLQGFDNATIALNTVRNIEGWFNTQLMGISLGDISATGQNAVVERNTVTTVFNHNTGTFGAYGINLAAGNTNTVRNNFVSGVTGDMTGGAAFSTTFGLFGIRVGTGTGHKVYHNSVNLFGLRTGTAATSLLGAAFGIVSTTQTGMDVRNNIFVNNLSGGTTSIAYVAVYLPSGGTSAMNLTLNNNDYFNSAAPAANQGVGQAGTTAGTNFFTQANFDPTQTTPATNFRAYTSTLSAGGANDNATKKVDPQFVSNTDLHIAPASPMVDMGASVGVGNDIDGQARVPPPDIGADEPGGITPPANDIAATAIIVPANGSTAAVGASVAPQASFTNNGTATQTNVQVRFTIGGPGGYTYSDTQLIASINPGQTVTVNFAVSSMFTTAGTYNTAALVLTPDANSANDTVMGTLNVVSPISGTVSVGTGQTYTSLTNAGGIFEALNVAGASSNIIINITSDLTGETGLNPLNQLAGGFTVTIKPSGAARTVTGTAANLSLIKLNGADNVTIDGSLAGGTDRSLTLTYGNTGGTVIWIASASASNGATGNTVKNCILSGNAATTIISGVLAGSGTTLGGDAETANSNNTIQNNSIFRVQNATFLRGPTAAPLDQNWLVTGNDWGSTVAADKLLFRGMLIGNAQNFTVSNNTIAGISSTTVTSSTMSGIQIALLVNGGTITGNKISDVKQNNTAGWGSNGIYFTSSSTAANVTVANNFISDVASQGFNGQADTDNGYGIVVALGGGYKIYHNSVLLNTNQGAGAASGQTAAINILTGLAAGAVDLRDNALASTQTLGTRYGVICNSANTVFSNINYNDYFAQNVGFIGGSARPTLANWQTGTGQDANSIAVDPLFVTTTAPADLHLQAASTLVNAGTNVGVTTDIDGQTRDAMPDIGADEVVVATPGTVQFSAPTYSVAENVAGGLATITVTRTGGSSGAASVNYATTSGTATGGASCGSGVDYVTTSGTLNWADADGAPKTFTVTICNETLFENDETFDVTLSGATGATLGAQTTATVTITNDDAAPSPPSTGAIIISEFRLRGPGGATDEFIELYNTTGVPLAVGTSAGTGFAVVASDGVVRCTVPNGTTFAARGHYLCVNSGGYSLASYPAGDGTTATGDAIYTTDIPDNMGLALFNNNTPANFTLANRLDAVGSTAEANTLYKEGIGYPALTPGSGIDYSFYRDMNNPVGAPKDTDNNAADFLFVDTNGSSVGAGSRLGAPGPENLSSPTQRNATIKASLIDPVAGTANAPNRVRDFTPGPAATSSLGTLDIRRKFTNNTGQPVARLRFRIVDLTTFPSPSGTADLRPITSSQIIVSTSGGNVTVEGTTLEQPATQTNGGGFNSSMSAGTVTLATPIAAGASVNLRFLLGVKQAGAFRFFINVEAQTNPPTSNSKSGNKRPDLQSGLKQPDLQTEAKQPDLP